MFDLEAALDRVTEWGGSDLHLKHSSPPLIRIHGELQPIPHSSELTAEETERALEQHGGSVPLRGDHLAGDVSIPDQAIELVLFGRERFLQCIGMAADIGGMDGFVGFLRGFF